MSGVTNNMNASIASLNTIRLNSKEIIFLDKLAQNLNGTFGEGKFTANILKAMENYGLGGGVSMLDKLLDLVTKSSGNDITFSQAGFDKFKAALGGIDFNTLTTTAALQKVEAALTDAGTVAFKADGEQPPTDASFLIDMSNQDSTAANSFDNYMKSCIFPTKTTDLDDGTATITPTSLFTGITDTKLTAKQVEITAALQKYISPTTTGGYKINTDIDQGVLDAYFGGSRDITEAQLKDFISKLPLIQEGLLANGSGFIELEDVVNTCMRATSFSAYTRSTTADTQVDCKNLDGSVSSGRFNSSEIYTKRGSIEASTTLEILKDGKEIANDNNLQVFLKALDNLSIAEDQKKFVLDSWLRGPSQTPPSSDTNTQPKVLLPGNYQSSASSTTPKAAYLAAISDITSSPEAINIAKAAYLEELKGKLGGENNELYKAIATSLNSVTGKDAITAFIGLLDGYLSKIGTSDESFEKQKLTSNMASNLSENDKKIPKDTTIGSNTQTDIPGIKNFITEKTNLLDSKISENKLDLSSNGDIQKYKESKNAYGLAELSLLASPSDQTAKTKFIKASEQLYSLIAPASTAVDNEIQTKALNNAKTEADSKVSLMENNFKDANGKSTIPETIKNADVYTNYDRALKKYKDYIANLAQNTDNLATKKTNIENLAIDVNSYGKLLKTAVNDAALDAAKSAAATVVDAAKNELNPKKTEPTLNEILTKATENLKNYKFSNKDSEKFMIPRINKAITKLLEIKSPTAEERTIIASFSAFAKNPTRENTIALNNALYAVDSFR